jgi:hypothetical protein
MSSDDIVTLIGHLAWPLTVIGILVFLRRQIADGIEAIVTRIRDRSTEVTIGREGLRLTTRVASLEANAETQQIKSEVLAQTLTTAHTEVGRRWPSRRHFAISRSRIARFDRRPDVA